VQYLLPCTEHTAAALRCDPHDEATCVPCPLTPAFAQVRCCVASERESNTMAGEFYRLPAGSHPEPAVEGGHAMGLVGYTDVFRTHHGFVGGWILKNSWWDGVPPKPTWKHARGSHSIEYFLQEISSADETHVCPNSASPQSWYQCAGLADCRSETSATYARAANSPIHLTCLDASPYVHGLCTRDEPLFLESITPWGADLVVGCFLRDRGATPHTGTSGDSDAGPIVNRRQRRRQLAEAGHLICSPPVPVDDLALVATPVPAERYPNDVDLCGHYLFPYAFAEELNAVSGGFEVADMDVRWDARAYEANSKAHPHLDYSLLHKDTYVQGRVRKRSPLIRSD